MRTDRPMQHCPTDVSDTAPAALSLRRLILQNAGPGSVVRDGNLRSEVAMNTPATISEGATGATMTSRAISQDAAGAGSAPAADAVKILIDSPSKMPSLGSRRRRLHWLR